MRLPLPRDEVHLWYLLPGEVAEAELLERYRALLTSEEIDRTDRFVFERNQVEQLQTRALVRTVLGRYVDQDPASLRFTLTEHGRPELTEPADSGIVFNVSNTEGLIACIVGRDRLLGVDVEWLHRTGQTVEIAEHFFSEREVEELRALPSERQRDRFFDYWTLKEAYVKARGIGLGLPLDRFSFELAGPQISIAMEPELGDQADRWWFRQLALSPEHKVAVAVTHLVDRAPPRLALAKTTPLDDPIALAPMPFDEAARS